MLTKICRYISLLIFTLAIVFLVGCSYPDFKRPLLRNYLHDTKAERPPEPDIFVDQPPGEWEVALRGDDMAVSPEAYILGPDDVVEIRVLLPDEQEPELEIETSVTREGRLRCPLVGEIEVAGLNVQQLTHKLSELYADGYYRDPYVVLTVVEHLSRRAMVFGHVSEPGSYPVMGERTSLLHLLLEAGGLETGAGDNVTIIRGPSFRDDVGPDELDKVTENVDIEHLMRQGDLRYNVWIYPGDMVHLRPEAPTQYYYVLGFAADGAYEIPEDRQLGVMGAVVGAGGLNEVARPQYTYLLRYEDGETQPTVYNLDLSRIAAGEQPDIPIQPEDRIIVSTDWLRRAYDGLLKTLRLRPLAPTPSW